MKISESWVRSWVNPSIDTTELVAKLTMAGLEVDGFESVANEFDKVVVGEILSTEQHPDADKLRVCQVNDGENTLQIVCGAPNARPGIKVPLAQVGAKLSDDFKIKKAKLRGVESNGMLCARDELGVSGDSDGLWELPSDAPIGANIRKYLELDDKVIEIDLTPNRADCFCVRGIARDIGVFCSMDVTEPTINVVPAQTEKTFPVELNASDACPVYVGRVVEEVDLTAETPLWMQERLARADIGSIHPAVDVTNYVMLELGQPMHAFDLDRLEGGIDVRYAKKGEKLTLLDEKEVELNEDTLLIADAKKPLAMAGVMGGFDSGVSESTTNIFFESAYFNPLVIAGKAREYGLHTDSSLRFERGVDYALQERAIERATELLVQIAGGKAGPVQRTAIEDKTPQAAEIALRLSRLNLLIGREFSATEVDEILTRLGVEILDADGSAWKVRAPTWRFDMEIEADLIEEVARIYGYDRLPERTLATEQPIEPHKESTRTLHSIKQHFASRGFSEVINYSFISPAAQELCFPGQPMVSVKNPIASDMSVMRTSLVSGLLKSAQYNVNRQQQDLRLFEAGMVFLPDEDKISQVNRIGGFMTGSREPELWANSAEQIDFFDAKREVELLLEATLGDAVVYEKVDLGSFAHPGQSARILQNDKEIGWIARLHPTVQSKMDIEKTAFLFELDTESVFSQRLPSFRPLSKFPGVRRDIALLVDKSIQVSELIAEAHKHCGELLTESRIFDIYHGQGIDSNEKSVGMGLTFRDYSRTLNDELVTQKVDDLVRHLTATHNTRLR